MGGSVSQMAAAAKYNAAAVCLFVCLISAAPPAVAADAPSAALDALFQSYDRDSAPYFPFTASDLGMREFDGMLADDLSEEYRRGLGSLCAGFLAKLKVMERVSLDRQRQLSYDIFRHRLESCIEGLAYPWHLLPINQAGFSLPSRFPVIGVRHPRLPR